MSSFVDLAFDGLTLHMAEYSRVSLEALSVHMDEDVKKEHVQHAVY